VFLHRVKRMLDCLIPCNLCCRQGCCGGGGSHGCILGGKLWGHCGICCGGCGLEQPCGGCCTNPCGSAFAPSCGGHCNGCGAPGVSDPFLDDPLPAPNPTSIPTPSPGVRRMPGYRTQPAIYQSKAAIPGRQVGPQGPAYARAVGPQGPTYMAQAQMFVPVQVRPASQKAAIVAARRRQEIDRAEQAAPVEAAAEATAATTATTEEIESEGSVLKRVSVEQEIKEPAPLFIDYPSAKPIARPQPAKISDVEVPANPLRR
jgi:hypothetical protein